MIKVGQNPEKEKNINKFIGQDGEGQRGKIIALRKDGRAAIIISQNNSFGGKTIWGGIYLIVEIDDNTWPSVVMQVNAIPNTLDWYIV